MQTAHALPPIAVHAEVHGHQGVELLRYRSQPAPGRTVTFFETGGGLPLHRLGAITRAHGTLRFRPQHGATRHRLIVAEISERGFTVGAPRRLANFSAPPEPRLTRPRAITVRRRGSTIVISWRRVASASRYAVRALLTDGRQLLWLTRARTIRLPHVPGFDAGHVLVAALDSSNHPGPVATTRLRAVQVTCQRPRAVRGRLVCAARRKRRKPRQPHRKHR